MKYRIIHRTTYRYKYPVAFGNHVACLTPRSLTGHQCTSHHLRILPAPSSRSERMDYYGNQINLFTVQSPHRQLIVEARSEVTLTADRQSLPPQWVLWEEVVKSLPKDHSAASLEAYQFVFDSPRIHPGIEFASYAALSFTRGRSFADALLDLTARIHNEFTFDSKATNVRTSSEEFFRKKRGVCQDFAHFQIACLRSLQLPARYVSGYLRTYPPPGQERLRGADASHAWVSVYCPQSGWIDLDPTNNLVVGNGHVTVAWGRDYGDVSPLRGLIVGGREHTLRVSVDVEPLDEDQARPELPS